MVIYFFRRHPDASPVVAFNYYDFAVGVPTGDVDQMMSDGMFNVTEIHFKKFV
jgi:hypothetical protein